MRRSPRDLRSSLSAACAGRAPLPWRSPVGTIIVDSGLQGVWWRHEPHPVPRRTSRPPALAAGVCRFFSVYLTGTTRLDLAKLSPDSPASHGGGILISMLSQVQMAPVLPSLSLAA